MTGGGAARTHSWWSWHTNLQATLDQVKGHHGGVCEATAQDAPKATEDIVLIGAERTAHVVCGTRGGHTRYMHTCKVTCGANHRTTGHIRDGSHRHPSLGGVVVAVV